MIRNLGDGFDDARLDTPFFLLRRLHGKARLLSMPAKPANCGLLRPFAILPLVSTFPTWRFSRPEVRKSPADIANIPVFRRLWLETWFDTD